MFHGGMFGPRCTSARERLLDALGGEPEGVSDAPPEFVAYMWEWFWAEALPAASRAVNSSGDGRDTAAADVLDACREAAQENNLFRAISFAMSATCYTAPSTYDIGESYASSAFARDLERQIGV